MTEVTLTDVLHAELDEEERQIDYKRIKKHWVIKRDNKDFILYAGLLDLLHQESNGHFTISTQLVQAPTAENGQTAIVLAVAGIMAADDPGGLAPLYRTASGIGDANPGNVSGAMQKHTIRMAETRAKGRALRDLLNVPMVTIEELGPEAKEAPVVRQTTGVAGPNGTGIPEGPTNFNPREIPGVAQGDFIEVEGRKYSRDQVWGFYQQRLSQAKNRNVIVPGNLLVNRNAPLKAIVAVTQTLKGKLEQPAPAAQEPLPEAESPV